MVNAIAPNAPIGAAFITMAMTPNTPCAASSMKRAQRMAALAEAHQREAEQDREQQHLQDFALREGADHGVGNDVQEEVDALLRLGLLGVAGDRLRVRHGAAEARAGPDHIADDKTDHQREGGDDLEIDQRLDADAADLLGILDMRRCRTPRCRR